jgi:hypothetical protein
VRLTKYDALTEFTPAARSVFYQFTFPRSDEATIAIDVAHSIRGTPRASHKLLRLVPSLPRSVGLRPVFLTLRCLGQRTVTRKPTPVDAQLVIVFHQHLFKQALEYPGFTPLAKAPMS